MSPVMSVLPHDQMTAEAGKIPLHVLLDQRFAESPHDLAFRFISDGEQAEELLSYGQLALAARSLASELINNGTTGKPVLLIHPPGPDFIIGLFACWYAGAIAVPCYPPRGSRHRKRMDAMLRDSGAGLALAPADQTPISGVTMIAGKGHSPDSIQIPAVEYDAPCLLQYTSGSTAEPKGVMISHGNFRSHFAALQLFDELQLKSALSWLPPYHDMGLVLKILYAFEAGIPLTFFSPEHFIQRPIRWLRAISHYRAELSGAPNFAFEMCLRSIRDDELTGLDLSCWKAAPCGAERTRPETLERFTQRFSPYGFRPEAFLPGYGLAETTLIVTASPANVAPRQSRHPQFGTLVSSGTPLPGVGLRIVDPENGQIRNDREIGEIRVKAPVVSSGYWKRPLETAAVFGTGAYCELRTGDLGYLEDGHLYVTGRIKDLIIIDGINHSPEDIEAAVFSKIPQITAAAAFATDCAGREAITLAVEVEGVAAENRVPLCLQIRHVIAASAELPIHRVILVRNGLLPRTTSGKIRRSACREAVENDTLKSIFTDSGTADPATNIQADGSLAVVLAAVAEVTGRNGARADDDIIGFGMSSMETTRLAALIELRAGVSISIGRLFAARSFAEIADSLSHNSDKPQYFPAIIPHSGLHANILTHSQERMWYLHQLDPGSAAYHVFGSLEMTGPINITALDSAIAAVISRHDILRSRHGIDHGRPHVRIDPSAPPPLEIFRAADERELQSLLSRFAKKPFVLAHESAIRTCIIACGEGHHILAICAHHIIADGWSLRIIGREIEAYYSAFCENKPGPTFPPKPNYLDYAASHRRWADGPAMDSQIDYWKSKLAGHPGIIQLASDFPRPNKPSSDGGAIETTLSAGLCNQVSALARIHRSTPFMVHLAAFLLLLRRHGAGDDPVVAIPVANRKHPAAGDLIGTLVNTLPFRLSLDPAESFRSLLERIREATFEMQANQDAPFERIIESVKPGRSRDHSPLAQVMFDHQEIPVAETWSGGLQCKPFIAHRGAVQFDLSLLLTIFSDRQQLSVEYRTDLFLAETATAFLQRYVETLEQVCIASEKKLHAIAALSKDDSQWLATASQGPSRPDFPSQTTPALISKRAAMHPQRPAYEAAGETVDYGTLETRSNHLAYALVREGVRPGDRVAVLLNRDASLPIALLATWKTGAAYVPLDHANPTERLKLIIEDQSPLHVLASPELTDQLPAGTPTILLDQSMMGSSDTAICHQNFPTDPAYVIYTSGSTGKPKGVVVSHGALANFLLSMAEIPGFTEADRLLAVTTISFDISALEIFLPLVTGGNFKLLSTNDSRNGQSLLEELKSSRATVMQATPATWRLLIDSDWKGSSNLKILCGGEALDLPLAVQLRKLGCQLWNLYGPTETTVWSTLWQVPQNPETIRIGCPIANTGIHILAPDGSPLPPGVTGELWISGAGLADGYWQNPELTGENFVSSRYHTGDLARWRRDGTLECLGRSDGQVKIRGFRVELGEIEAVIAAHPQIAQAKVAFRGADAASKKLIAWVTAASSETLDLTTLRNFISERLPNYMMPTDIGIIDSFPLNSNGKVDTAKLAAPAVAPESEAPVTATEQELAAIWSELLERPSIHRDDDWFHVGGHSLLALRLFARIHRDFQRSLPLSAILDHPTLRLLATMIDESEPAISVSEP